MKPVVGRSRVVIEDVRPQIDAGRYPVCRVLGDEVVVTAAVFADGHDHLGARLLYRSSAERRWRFTQMTALGNDLWTGSFKVDRVGTWCYTVEGWTDHFDTWASDLKKRLAAQVRPASAEAAQTEKEKSNEGGPEPGAAPVKGLQEIPLALRSGVLLLQQAAKRTRGTDAKRLIEAAASLALLADQNSAYYDDPITPEILSLAGRCPDLAYAMRFQPELNLRVDRERARFSAWYELFPRSASLVPGRHGSFQDVEAQLPEIAAMGFDILYLPPIHPIGRAFRKGRNNSIHSGDG